MAVDRRLPLTRTEVSALVDRALTEVTARADLVVDDEQRWSSAALLERVAVVAGGLHSVGVGAGDAVCWQRPNVADGVVLYRSCWRLGAVPVPIHHLAGPRDRERVIETVAPTFVVGDDLPTGDAITTICDEDGPGVVLFTSGSSGTPKGVVHTRGALAYKARLMAEMHGLTAEDSILMPAPLAHISGLLNGVTLPGVVGMKTVLMAKWEPAAALRLIERERITFMIGPPTFFVGMMSDPSFSSAAVRSLRLVSSGGAGVTPAFVDRASEAFDCVVKRTYGSTEAPTVTTSRPGDDRERARTTDGRPTGAVELRVDEVTGELLVRGPELFTGYLDQAQTDAAFTSDGFFRTGDIGRLDDGWLTITGRLKDIIIRGGENVAVAEVEGALELHPAVAHAVVIGVPHERLGEQVVAFVQLTAGARFDLDECRRSFTEQGLARFKTPEHVVVVDEIPMMAAGKPDRDALRRLL
ncbi:MAG TPA: AMP-binding protein [Acidimicrobiales bacterium]|nr:AMP-binding protein [Acidimicrobiales bacterium]